MWFTLRDTQRESEREIDLEMQPKGCCARESCSIATACRCSRDSKFALKSLSRIPSGDAYRSIDIYIIRLAHILHACSTLREYDRVFINLSYTCNCSAWKFVREARDKLINGLNILKRHVIMKIIDRSTKRMKWRRAILYWFNLARRCDELIRCFWA